MSAKVVPITVKPKRNKKARRIRELEKENEFLRGTLEDVAELLEEAGIIDGPEGDDDPGEERPAS